nr:hypothetical protein [Parafrankia irregularis]
MTFHYRRPNGRYDGWSLEVDVDGDRRVTGPDDTDEFGLFWKISVPYDAPELVYTLRSSSSSGTDSKRGRAPARSDPAEVHRQKLIFAQHGYEVWYFSGDTAGGEAVRYLPRIPPTSTSSRDAVESQITAVVSALDEIESQARSGQAAVARIATTVENQQKTITSIGESLDSLSSGIGAFLGRLIPPEEGGNADALALAAAADAGLDVVTQALDHERQKLLGAAHSLPREEEPLPGLASWPAGGRVSVPVVGVEPRPLSRRDALLGRLDFVRGVAAGMKARVTAVRERPGPHDPGRLEADILGDVQHLRNSMSQVVDEVVDAYEKSNEEVPGPVETLLVGLRPGGDVAVRVDELEREIESRGGKS